MSNSPGSDTADGPGLRDALRMLVARGGMTFGADMRVDVVMLTRDPFEDEGPDISWDSELEQITSLLNNG